MTLDQNLTLFENSKHILAELKLTNMTLQRMVIYQQQTTEHLLHISDLLDGFTNGGASLNGYIPDAFVQAYVAVVSPVLAERLGGQDVDLEELMKGATLLARRLLEELSAYRSEQEAKDILSEAMAHVDDPWDRPDTSPSELDP